MSISISRPTLAVLGAISLAACASSDRGAAPAQEDGTGDRALTSRFDGPAGSLPSGWRTGTSNPRGGPGDAHWELRDDPTAPSAPGVLALADARGHAGETFNLCWTPAVSLGDVDVSVAVHAGGGAEDRGGGPAWRVAGENDYYLARWNPLEDNFRVYSVQRGVRLQLASARVHADPGAWHTIRARHVGDAITCWLDGEELLHATDAKLTAPGGAGVWTKADATSRFDDFAAGPAR